jgi:lysozyme family protein
MARLNRSEILRSAPNGAPDGVFFTAGTNIDEIKATQGDQTKIRIGANEGWVPTSSIDAAGTSAGASGPFVENDFADLCVLHCLTYDVNPHYCIGVAKFRSGLTASDDGDKIGPFRLTAADWATISEGGLATDDLKAWDLQPAGFAAMVERHMAALGANASPVDLYKAQWPDAPADIAGKLKIAFDDTAVLEGAAEVRVIGAAAPNIITDPNAPPPKANKNPTLRQLTATNAQRWQSMVITPAKIPDVDRVARRLVANKARYQDISNTTSVPWFIIAVIHEREKGNDTQFLANIAQGDRWDRVSVNVPKGRGPFVSFKEAAIDALTKCAPFAADWTDWSAGGAMTLLEQYNGLGYAFRGLPSPYIWSFSNQYVKGKFAPDHVFNPDMVDPQLGSAPLLKQMQAADPSITFP